MPTNSELINELVSARDALDRLLGDLVGEDITPEIEAASERVLKAEDACTSVGMRLINT